jgi:hypothetical protein
VGKIADPEEITRTGKSGSESGWKNWLESSLCFVEADDIEAGLIQTGALEYRLEYASRPEFENTLMPAEPFIAYLAGGSELNKLREKIDILKSHGIKIGGYLPCGDFRVDAMGQLYWTHPAGNSTGEFK